MARKLLSHEALGTQNQIVHNLFSPAVLACPEPAKQSEAE